MVRTARHAKQKREAQPQASASAFAGGSSHTHAVSLEGLFSTLGEPTLPSYVHRVSSDTRRAYVEEIPLVPPSPVKRLAKRQRLEQTTEEIPPSLFAPDPGFEPLDRYVMGLDKGGAPPPAKAPSVKSPPVVKPADPSLHKWRAKRDMYLSNVLRRDGTMDANTEACPGCAGKEQEPPRYRCADCFGDVLYCRECSVARHAENPLHRIHAWNRKHFVKTSLAKLGLRVQLGHVPHACCSAPKHANSGFVALHLNGIHEVNIDFCGCENRLRTGPPEVQLLRAGWFPATHERPQTCATFECLEKFQQDTLQAKTTMYDFYGVLEKLSDNTGIKPPDRYHEWIRMCRQFAHLLLLKRAGRLLAYDVSGVLGTKQGGLALKCPACPRPGVNIPDGWEKATPEERYIYTVFLALDACFHLKRRLISSKLRDPDLGSRWAYQVETTTYRDYLRDVTDQKEMNTCSGLAALDYANTKFSHGYSTTGVGMCVCARHEFAQPNGMGDLQRGERFANMDYIFACVQLHIDVRLFKLISYDIMCIWKASLIERLKALPEDVRVELEEAFLQFAIPKMHIHSHTLACQLLFSLNLILGACQVEGEGIERAWSSLGGVAMSTRDMGPGSRHDTLDAQLSYWNWQKLVHIVESLRRRLDRATEELKLQTESFETFSAQQADSVAEWKEAVHAYERDATLKNPYEITIEGLTENQVRLQFAKEEKEEIAHSVPSHDVSASAFVVLGLDLEEDQRKLCVNAELKKAGTTGMQIDLKKMCTALSRKLIRFCTLQKTYMPAALQVLGNKSLPANTLEEDVPLLLPSALTVRERARCVPGLAEIEALLHDAQCRTALTRLRNQLHIKTRLLLYKKLQVRHQGPNTRARTVVTRNESKIRLHSEKYQTAWEALRRLNAGDEALVGWQVLKADDIRCMEDAEDLSREARKRKETAEIKCRRDMMLHDHGLLPAERDDDMDWEGSAGGRGSENTRALSWIWTHESAGSDAGMEEALKVEWAKAYARGKLLSMRPVFGTRIASVPIGVIPCAEAQAAVAYATKQANMYRDLKARGEMTWVAPKPARGKRSAHFVPMAVSALDADDAAEEEDNIGDDESDDEVGIESDIEGDEEFIMGGEGYND